MLKPLGEARSLDPVERCAAELERRRGSITARSKSPRLKELTAISPTIWTLRSPSEKRGISRLYSHQAQAWDVVSGAKTWWL